MVSNIELWMALGTAIMSSIVAILIAYLGFRFNSENIDKMHKQRLEEINAQQIIDEKQREKKRMEDALINYHSYFDAVVGLHHKLSSSIVNIPPGFPMAFEDRKSIANEFYKELKTLTDYSIASKYDVEMILLWQSKHPDYIKTLDEQIKPIFDKIHTTSYSLHHNLIQPDIQPTDLINQAKELLRLTDEFTDSMEKMIMIGYGLLNPH